MTELTHSTTMLITQIFNSKQSITHFIISQNSMCNNFFNEILKFQMFIKNMLYLFKVQDDLVSPQFTAPLPQSEATAPRYVPII